MHDHLRSLFGKTIVVTLRLSGVTPIKGTLTLADDCFVVVEQLKGTRRVPVHIPIHSVLYFVEDDEHH